MLRPVGGSRVLAEWRCFVSSLSLICLAMYWLPLTFVLSSSYLLVQAGYQTKGQSCSPANNRLQIGTYQFYSDCDIQTYCSSAGVCELKGCRKDQFPFGYAQNATLPPKCSSDQFCTDEGDACQPLLTVGSPCQLNRDGIYSLHCPWLVVV